MTTKTLAKAMKKKKPAVIREGGKPRYVVLDWDAYRKLADEREEIEDSVGLMEALTDPKNQKRIPLSRVRKLLKLP